MQSELAGHKSKPAQVELKYLQLLQIYKWSALSSRKNKTRRRKSPGCENLVAEVSPINHKQA